MESNWGIDGTDLQSITPAIIAKNISAEGSRMGLQKKSIGTHTTSTEANGGTRGRSFLNPASSNLSAKEGSYHFKETVVDGVVANATRFFRITKCFKAIRELILPEHLSFHPDRPFSVWSSACSSGEEPYSVAMYLLRLQSRMATNIPVEIIGTDINLHCIASARNGVYNLQKNAIEDHKGYFTTYGSLKGQVFTIGEDLRNLVRFRTFDLYEPPKHHSFNLIICANVFQYYQEEARIHFLKNFIQACRQPGYIYIDNIRQESLEALGVTFLPRYNLVRIASPNK